MQKLKLSLNVSLICYLNVEVINFDIIFLLKSEPNVQWFGRGVSIDTESCNSYDNNLFWFRKTFLKKIRVPHWCHNLVLNYAGPFEKQLNVCLGQSQPHLFSHWLIVKWHLYFEHCIFLKLTWHVQFDLFQLKLMWSLKYCCRYFEIGIK